MPPATKALTASPQHEADLWFDPWATSKGPALSSISSSITAQVLKASFEQGTRSPKAEVVERVGSIVSTIIANLYRLHRGEHRAPQLAVSRRHEETTRYDRKGFGQLPKVLDAMASLGLIAKHEAHIKKRRTGIEAAGWLLQAVLQGSILPSEVGRAEGEETIWLTARMGRNEHGRKLPAERIDYEDTPQTKLMRGQMEHLNAFLNAQRIELDGEPQGAFTLRRQFTLRSPDDPHTFNLHGRLYGGFWQTLPKARRMGLRINGEPIADLDFAGMFPRLGYLKLGLEPPLGDPYDIPGLEGHRDSAKAGLAALFSKASDMKQLPPEVKRGLPSGWTAKSFYAAVAAKHPALVQLFGRDIALDFMFTDSTILVGAMMRLAEKAIPSLPMHDGMMVPASAASQTKAAMLRASLKVAAANLPITVQR
jgi:hypothetical protein